MPGGGREEVERKAGRKSEYGWRDSWKEECGGIVIQGGIVIKNTFISQ